MNRLLELSQVSKRFYFYKNPFKKGYIDAIKDISFSINKGEIFALVGESGSGKSTIGKIILRLERPSEGRVVLEGKDIYAYRREYTRFVSAVFQDPSSSLNPHMKVKDIITEPLAVHGVKEKEEKLEKALELVKLDKDLVNRKPTQLSGGQRQRVAIARAIVLEPKLIVADEPTASLDASVRVGILELFKVLKNNGISVLFITHDIRSVEKIADRVGVLYRGVLMELGDKDSVLGSPKHPYTKYLLENIPVKHPSQRHQVDTQEPWYIEQAQCPFYFMCPDRLNSCKESVREVFLDGTIVKCNIY